jgi:hypothetical protein
MTNIALAGFGRFRHAPLLLLALAFVLFFVLASRFVDPFTLISQKGPLGGDTYGGAEIFLKLKYEWKRPLMGPVVWGATSLFRLIPGVVPTTAIALGLALLATLNLGLAYLVARRLTASPDIAVLATGCYALFLSTLIGLSIADSYTVSSLMVLLVLYVWLHDPAPSAPGSCLRLGGAIGLAGLCNTPLLLLAGLPILHALLAADPRRALQASFLVGGTASAMVGAVVLTHAALKHGDPAAYFERSGEYTARYAAADRLLEPKAYADVGATFFAYAVAAPKSGVPSRDQKAKYFKYYLRSPGGLVGLAAVVVVATLAVFAGFGRHWRIALPVLAFLAGITAFYAYFNPPDAMLYSIQLRPALFVVLTLGALSLPGSPRVAILVLAVVVTLLGARNLPIVLAGPYDFKVMTDLRKTKASKLGSAAATCDSRHPSSPRCQAPALSDRPSAAGSRSPGVQHSIQ